MGEGCDMAMWHRISTIRSPRLHLISNHQQIFQPEFESIESHVPRVCRGEKRLDRLCAMVQLHTLVEKSGELAAATD